MQQTNPITNPLASINLEQINNPTRVGTNDDLANQEKKHLFNDGERGEKLRKHIHWVFIVAIWVVALIMIALLLVRAAHFILPEKWHWLNEAQNHDIERILFSGVIVSVLGKYFTKYKLLE